MVLNENLEGLLINCKLLFFDKKLPFPGMGMDKNICSLLKGRLSTFYFVDCLDRHLVYRGSYSDGCDCIWIAKALPDIFKVVGSGQGHF